MMSSAAFRCLLVLLLVTACLLSGPACAPDAEGESAVSIAPLNLADGWRISAPETQGVCSATLLRAFVKASRWPFMYSTLVVRNGFLLAEGYFNGAHARQARYVASVTKSFLSALIGIAVAEGFIPGLELKMMPFFPEYDRGDVEPAKYDITLKHLLRMQAGYWHDSEDSRWQAWVNSPDWIDYLIRLPLLNPPGTSWNYSSGSSHLLSAILTKATGMPAEEFARQRLFMPLGIVLDRWGEDPQGYNYGGWDMYITPRDMARFGQLYLDQGQINGRQVVPAAWVRETTTPISSVSWPSGAIADLGYACHWWTGRMSVNGQHSLFMAQGHGGQNIVVVPALAVVVVTTTDPNSSFSDSWSQSVATFDFIVRDVLAAVANL